MSVPGQKNAGGLSRHPRTRATRSGYTCEVPFAEAGAWNSRTITRSWASRATPRPSRSSRPTASSRASTIPMSARKPTPRPDSRTVGEAYEVLRDPEKRAAYDQLGSGHRAGEEFRPPPDWGSGFEFRGAGRPGPGEAGGFGYDGDASEFFESLFGRAGSAGGRAAPATRSRRGPSRPRHHRPGGIAGRRNALADAAHARGG